MAHLAKAPADYVHELNSLPDLVLLVDAPDMRIVDVNEQGARELGWTPEEVIGDRLADFGDPADRELNPVLIEKALEGETVRFDRRVRDANGEWRTYNFAARIVDGETTRFLLVGRDMSALAHSYSRLADLLKLADLTDDLFVVSDSEGYVTYVNEAVHRVHGDDKIVGRHLTEFVHEDDRGFATLLGAIGADDKRAEARVLARRYDGSPLMLGVRTIYDEETRRWFTVERDISDTIAQEQQMQKLTTDLRRRATTDELTGVANRAALNEILDASVAEQTPFALLLLDMDDFKSVNDTLGHAAGDEFLRCVAQRLQRAVKLTDVVARLGGDEFVVYLPDVTTEDAAGVAARMIDAVGQHYSINGHSLTRSCSIGVAVWEEGDDVNDILRKADRAAYRAKHEGRSRFIVY